MRAIAKPCAEPGCAALVYDGRHCQEHKREVAKAYDDRRGSSAQRGYDSKWKKARAQFLRDNPLCAMCQAKGRFVAARVVDHKLPFRRADGSIDRHLQWSRSNWQSLCTPCHSGTKQQQDRAARASSRG